MNTLEKVLVTVSIAIGLGVTAVIANGAGTFDTGPTLQERQAELAQSVRELDRKAQRINGTWTMSDELEYTTQLLEELLKRVEKLEGKEN